MNINKFRINCFISQLMKKIRLLEIIHDIAQEGNIRFHLPTNQRRQGVGTPSSSFVENQQTPTISRTSHWTRT